MSRINSRLLLQRVQDVEAKYQSVNFAPISAMRKVWRLTGAVIPDDPHEVYVTRRTYTIIQVSVGRGLSVKEISGLLNRRQVETHGMVQAYRHNELKITKRGWKHDQKEHQF